MKIIKLFNILFIFLLVQCSAPEQIARFEVQHLNHVDSISTNNFVYALPQTTIRIHFEVTRTEEIPGPYGEYAEILLGLEDVIDSYDEYYDISHVAIDTYQEPDPDEYYIVQYDSNFFHYSFQLSELGFLMAVNDTNKLFTDATIAQGIQSIYPRETFDFGWTDRFVKRNIETKKQRKYRTVTTDSSSYRVPYTRTSYEAKSVKNNAEEAANFIIKLRKRKFKLMAGLYENAPDNEAVPKMIEKLEELEHNYVSMFSGDIKQTTYQYTFEYTPDPNNAIKSYTLCYFSENKGMFTLQDLSSSPNLDKGLNIRPINIHIDADIAIQANLEMVAEKLLKQSLIYKLPVYTKLEMTKGNDLLFSKKLQITQFGQKLYIPVDRNKPQKINFSPVNGALERVELK